MTAAMGRLVTIMAMNVLLPPGGTHEQQVGNVRACNEQHKHHRCGKDEQRLARVRHK